MADQLPRTRPLSPYWQVILKGQLTSAMSICHRMAGVALAVGTLAVAWVLVSLATSADAWEACHQFFTSPIGRFFLSGWAAAFFYHFCNGIRHLTWDTGRALTIKGAYTFGYAVLLIAALLTLFALWKIWF